MPLPAPIATKPAAPASPTPKLPKLPRSGSATRRAGPDRHGLNEVSQVSAGIRRRRPAAPPCEPKAGCCVVHHRPPAERGRYVDLILNELRERRACCRLLKPPGLLVQPADRLDLLGLAELRLLDGAFQNADCFVVTELMPGAGWPSLAAMGERKRAGSGKAVRRAMDHLGHHRRARGSCAPRRRAPARVRRSRRDRDPPPRRCCHAGG